MFRLKSAIRLALCLLVPQLLLASDPASQEIKRTLLVRAQPDYPELARKIHVVGEVVLMLTIEPDGHVSQVEIKSGHPLLRLAAQSAALRWKYSPAPTSTTSLVRILFELP